MREFNKIFNVGLPKTGTTSFGVLMERLGIRTLYASPEIMNSVYLEGNYNFPGDWRCLTNLCEWHFRQLDETYPNSLFVLSTRNLNDWLQSIRSQFERDIVENKHSLDYLTRSYIYIFGQIIYNENLFADVFIRHHDVVRQYFEDRDNFLVLDLRVSEELRLKQLEEFLDVELSSYPLCHSTKLCYEDKVCSQHEDMNNGN